MGAFVNLNMILVLISLLTETAMADCMSWDSGKYKASDFDSSAMDDAVKEAFSIQNSKEALVSFNKCVFIVRPQYNANLLTFDYSKDKDKCDSVKAIFEANLIGCEQTKLYPKNQKNPASMQDR